MSLHFSSARPLHSLLPRVHYHWFRKWNAISSPPSPEPNAEAVGKFHSNYLISLVEDLLESPAVAGLGFIHFALSRRSQEAQAILAGRRPQSVLDRDERCAGTMEFANLP